VVDFFSTLQAKFAVLPLESETRDWLWLVLIASFGVDPSALSFEG
jgi:hypothetical protein